MFNQTEYMRKYRKEHPQKNREACKRYREKNPEKTKQYNHEQYLKRKARKEQTE